MCDFENFDGHLMAQIMDEVLYIVNSWYGNDKREDNRVRTVLFEYIKSSVWKVRGYIAMLKASQPSGNWFTTMLNSCYQQVLIRDTFLALAEKNGIDMNLNHFEKYVKCCSYGDDSIISISDAIIDWFNQETIIAQVNSTGHKMTDGLKGEFNGKARKLSEASFLKRGFTVMNGLYYAPLAKETITEMISWRSDKITAAEGTMVNTRTASMEAFAHGKDYFDWFYKQVDDWSRARGVPHDMARFQTALEWWTKSLTCTNDGRSMVIKMEDALGLSKTVRMY